MDNGVLKCVMTDVDGVHIILTSSYDYSKSYHFGFSTKGGAGVIFQNPKMVINPFYEQDLERITTIMMLDEKYNYGQVSNLGVVPTIVTLFFPLGVRQILGFSTEKHQLKTLKGKFKAHKALDSVHIPSSVIVESNIVDFYIVCLFNKR